MKENRRGVVELKDLSLVVCLVILGFPILTMDPKDYPYCGFLFENTKELEETTKNFFDGNLRIEPTSYWAKIREIKSRIESIKN